MDFALEDCLVNIENVTRLSFISDILKASYGGKITWVRAYLVRMVWPVSYNVTCKL